MKKTAWILALIGLLFVGDRVGGVIMKRLTEKSQFRYSRLYRGDARCDILFVGNSRGLGFYQPHVEARTGLSTLNISYNGLPMDLANVLVKDHLDRHESPGILMIDITMCDRRNKELVAGFNLYRRFSLRLDSFLLSQTPNNFYGGWLSHLYLYNSEIFQRSLFYLKKSDEDWLLDRVIIADQMAGISDVEPYTITMEDYLLSQLADLVEYARTKGVEVKLVVNPYFPPFAEKITNLDEIIKRVESATGLKVYNYSLFVDGHEGFGDYQHLNKYGSKIYLDKLIKDGLLDLVEKNVKDF